MAVPLAWRYSLVLFTNESNAYGMRIIYVFWLQVLIVFSGLGISLSAENGTLSGRNLTGKIWLDPATRSHRWVVFYDGSIASGKGDLDSFQKRMVLQTTGHGIRSNWDDAVLVWPSTIFGLLDSSLADPRRWSGWFTGEPLKALLVNIPGRKVCMLSGSGTPFTIGGHGEPRKIQMRFLKTGQKQNILSSISRD
jgi:hypothetical protein